MMRTTITFLLVTIMASAFAQGARTINPDEVNTKKARVLYGDGEYAEVISLLEPMAASGNKSADVLYWLASSCAYIGSYDRAVVYFQSLFSVEPEYTSVAYYECGYSFDALNRFDEAIPLFEKCIAKSADVPHEQKNVHRARYKLQYAKQQAALIHLPVKMKAPQKLSLAVNTKYPEYLPMSDPTGKRLYFTSDRKGGISKELADEGDFDEDLFFIENSNGVWTTPELLPEPINTVNNDGAASFSADGQTMIYGACGRDDGIGSCDLYISYLTGKQWSTPANMGNVVNSSSWDAHSTISYDGNRIIFASNREEGYGDSDLYMTEKNIFGDWGIPVNLGSIVNTPFSEASPFLGQDGKTLYFASNGHPGYGSSDIFRSVYDNGKWSVPINMGRPLNTVGDDKYFTIGGAGDVGYFSSDRDGNLDLYEVEIPEDMRPQPTVVVSGIVVSSKTNLPVDAYVLVENLNSGELIAVSKSNSVTGKYLIVLPAGITYSVSANKEGYFFFSQRFDIPLTSKFQEIKKDITLKPIEKGAKVILNNIFFETGKSSLSPQSRLELQKAIKLMEANPTMVIEVGGHTDNVGDDALNMKLSHDRARSVLDYIVLGGIATSRVQAKGYGELNPIASNDTDLGKQANRRTEFIILEFN